MKREEASIMMSLSFFHLLSFPSSPQLSSHLGSLSSLTYEDQCLPSLGYKEKNNKKRINLNQGYTRLPFLHLLSASS